MKYLSLFLLLSFVLIGCSNTVGKENDLLTKEADSQIVDFNQEAISDTEKVANSRCAGKVDINRAPLEDLIRIVHISEDNVQEVINNRPFITLDSITLVRGIYGEKLRDIKSQNLACVDRN